MNINFHASRILVLICSLSILLTSSCSPKKEVAYFQNAKNFETVVDTDTFVPKFKVDDNVSIFVSTYDMEASRPFNLVRQIGTASGEVVNYLIDIDGNIDFPVLGKIKLLGLTVDEAKELIKSKLEEGYLKDPVVNIRILNFRVSVLGEVTRPGTYTITGERITLMQALATAGDLTIKGRRDNVLVVRDFKGTKTYTRVDLTNKELFNSPVYYLTQNDIVYVEPNHSASSGYFVDARLGTILSISSFITGVLILVTRSR
ncbi:polysaccharide biosynthesis/export family protein [Flavobacteriaceae bacterium SZ-1-7]|uniref:polysaccharide biosynthesis/export family protein n=1 Tax=Tamlana sedimenti TaxID=3134126 RepID=UPI00312221EE